MGTCTQKPHTSLTFLTQKS